MEPTKIESNELDMASAREAATAIVTLISSMQDSASEDAISNNARLRDVALRVDALSEALKITPPSGDLQARLARHRETEHRHRGQRTQICALLRTPWEQVCPRVKELLEDQRRAINLFGEVRAAAAAAGIDQDVDPVDMVRRLAAERGQASAPPPDYSGRLIAIHDALHAAGLTPAGADHLDPIDSVRVLIEERRELLEEMAKSVSQEQIVDALASDPPPSVRPEEPETVAEFMSGGDQSDPASLELLPATLRTAHEALISVISTSERDWTRAADLAWIYGVLVGWSEDDLEALQMSFGWREQVVRVIDEHRAALVCAGMSEL